MIYITLSDGRKIPVKITTSYLLPGDLTEAEVKELAGLGQDQDEPPIPEMVIYEAEASWTSSVNEVGIGGRHFWEIVVEDYSDPA